METRADYLSNMLSTVHSEYLPNAQEVAQNAERRLIELEDRDARRRAREDEQSREIAAKYPALKKEI